MTIQIETERFVLRELGVDDVSARYLSWFGDREARVNIAAAASTRTLEDLRAYVRERSGRDDVLFLGIFVKASGLHIGNLKYEPVNSAEGYAVMGILIGDPEYRGRGVAGEVLEASGRWLREHRQVKQVLLGVHRSNVAAIRAYEKVGFRARRSPYLPHIGPDGLSMAWDL